MGHKGLRVFIFMNYVLQYCRLTLIMKELGGFCYECETVALGIILLMRK